MLRMNTVRGAHAVTLSSLNIALKSVQSAKTNEKRSKMITFAKIYFYSR